MTVITVKDQTDTQALLARLQTWQRDAKKSNQTGLYDLLAETAAHNIAEDIKHGCAPIEVGCWHGEKPHGGCTVREAIDTAMREKAA